MSFKDSILKLKNSMNHCRRDPASICDTLAKGFADLYTNAEGGSASQNYSTTEQEIGKWMDNKTVYQKSYIIENPTANDFIRFSDPSMDTIENVISIDATYQRISGSNAMSYTLGSNETPVDGAFQSFLRVDMPDGNYKGFLYKIVVASGKRSSLPHGVASEKVIEEGDAVDVRGTSKGKGYAGVIKRWNFGRLKESHGTGPVHRHGGSLGVIDPARVFKGKKMAGHLGNERVTVQNLSVVKVDAEKNIIAVKGAVPGPKGGIVVLFDSVKA